MNELKTRVEKVCSQKVLLFSLVILASILLGANFFGKEITSVVANLIFIPVPGAVVVLSIILVSRYGKGGNHGRAWVLFTASAISWFIAEQIWMVLDLVYHQNPFPSFADYFYLSGYPFFFAFSILYLRPFKDTITKKLITVSILISIGLLVPTIYMSFESNSGEDHFAQALAAAYPVADATLLVPVFIGIVLFFRGHVNFMWSLLLLGILCNITADTIFQYLSLDNLYYTGHPVDVIFLWAYLLFAFGIYDHIKLFKKRNVENRFNDQQNLR